MTTTTSVSNKTTHSTPSSSQIPSHITIRAADVSDAEALSTCFFTSFWPSHPFWTHEWPPELFHPWFTEAFRMVIVDDPSMLTFVAVDTNIPPDTTPENTSLPPWNQKGGNVTDGRLVAFTRWRVPQEDGNLEEQWPDLPGEGIDMDVMDAFFGGMEVNHHELMGERPHWTLQLLGTETGYQGLGIGKCFVGWGCDRADEDGLEGYVEASSLGAPLYTKAGFVFARKVDVPDKESTYGHMEYNSYVRAKTE